MFARVHSCNISVSDRLQLCNTDSQALLSGNKAIFISFVGNNKIMPNRMYTANVLRKFQGITEVLTFMKISY